MLSIHIYSQEQIQCRHSCLNESKIVFVSNPCEVTKWNRQLPNAGNALYSSRAQTPNPELTVSCSHRIIDKSYTPEVYLEVSCKPIRSSQIPPSKHTLSLSHPPHKNSLKSLHESPPSLEEKKDGMMESVTGVWREAPFPSLNYKRIVSRFRILHFRPQSHILSPASLIQ